MSEQALSILVRQSGVGQWISPETTAYDDEAHLQSLLVTDPCRIPGVPDDSMAVREFSTSAGPIDVCVVGSDGSLTVVECKLAKNSEKRRMVIGQVIDYAAALRADGLKAFSNQWKARGGEDLDEALDPEGVEALEENLHRGRINLCLAVDRIDSDLRRLIEYLNLVTADEIMVTALQLSYAKHGDTEILIPSIFGAEIAGTKSPTHGGGEPWNWESFVEALTNPVDQAIANDLQARLEAIPATGSQARLWFGRRPGGGVFFQIHGERFGPFQLWQNSAHELMVFGNWRVWGALRNDERFAGLAEALGQRHTDGSRSVSAKALDIDAFWAAAVACDRAINDLDPL